MIVLDSFAWFEYFAGSLAGSRVGRLLQTRGLIYTSSSCLAEFKRKQIREGQSWKDEVAFIVSKSQVVPLSESIALRAGEHLEVHFADALVYATALELGATLVTGDPHFRGLPSVEFLE